jgi:hypothetical protein
VFLALSPVIATGRALFAFTVTVLSMSGHAALGAHHFDVSRLVLAFLLLLGIAWRSNDARALLGASAIAECLVHGGIPVGSLTMFSLHVSGTMLAFFLIWKFEALWAVCVEVLRPLLQPLLLPHLQPFVAVVANTEWRNPFVSLFRRLSTPVRGPPDFA